MGQGGKSLVEIWGRDLPGTKVLRCECGWGSGSPEPVLRDARESGGEGGPRSVAVAAGGGALL